MWQMQKFQLRYRLGGDVEKIAKEYEAAGADCISVLTEPKWFLGRDEYLKEISENYLLAQTEMKLKKQDCFIIILLKLFKASSSKYKSSIVIFLSILGT